MEGRGRDDGAGQARGSRPAMTWRRQGRQDAHHAIAGNRVDRFDVGGIAESRKSILGGFSRNAVREAGSGDRSADSTKNLLTHFNVLAEHGLR